MRHLSSLAIGCVLVLSSSALARDTKYLIKVSEVLEQGEGTLEADVRLFFGKQEGWKGEKRGIVTAKPTKATGKTDEARCKSALVSALKDLQKQAHNLGGTAVVGIKSFHDDAPFSSEDELECHVGVFATVVELRGTIVKEAKK